jgi:Kef-type K+ transport system membrane component KefB/mannitol/fructose-specific phosphotransferase system IIA component (Ntr-type)
MGTLDSANLTVLLLGLAVLLGSAHALGELARRLRQPAVIGEMLAGLLLGPTVLGTLAPGFQSWLFPRETPAAIGLDAIVALGVTLLLLVGGLEVDLSTIWRQGRATIGVALAGLLVPLGVGWLLAILAPRWWGMPPDGSARLFAIFFGTAMAVSALPVIAKIFLELDLFRSDIGMLALVAATVINLAVWMIFSVVLGGEAGASIGRTIGLSVGFTVLVLVVGRAAADRALPWVQAHLAWPGGVLGFVIIAGLVGGAITEMIGIHAIFGAFLVGIALGDSDHLREHTRHIVHRFVDGILAPIFVAAIGLEVNFIANFRPGLVLAVLAVGTATKVLGGGLAARLCGVGWSESWAAGWALNARGEMGIILGLLAWQAGVIRERLFVALVTLAIVSSALSGPMLMRLLRRGRSLDLSGLLDSRLCLTGFEARDAAEAIAALTSAAAERAGLDADSLREAVLRREALMPTGLGQGVAVPHARLPGLAGPIVAVGRLDVPVDFDAPDGVPVRLLFLIVTPLDDAGAQVRILGTIARLMRDAEVRDQALASRTPSQLLSTLKVAHALHKAEPVTP